MKLTDLNPKFVGRGGEGITNSITGEPVPRRDGVAIIFDCPKCGPDHPCCIDFDKPLDGGPQARPDTHVWQRTGDTFETLTLRPSILRKDCGWHGFITNGNVETC